MEQQSLAHVPEQQGFAHSESEEQWFGHTGQEQCLTPMQNEQFFAHLVDGYYGKLDKCWSVAFDLDR